MEAPNSFYFKINVLNVSSDNAMRTTLDGSISWLLGRAT